MTKVHWTLFAQARAREISRFIAQDNPTAARQWINEVFDKSERLALFPESGRQVPESERADLREIFHGNYRVIYRYDGQAVTILTVRHGRQLLPPEDLR